jgi:hypothetical protein
MKFLKKSVSRFINYKLQQNFGFILLATIPLHVLNLDKEPKGRDYKKCIWIVQNLIYIFFMMGQSKMIITKEEKIELWGSP